jgi:hypothetical protein
MKSGRDEEDVSTIGEAVEGVLLEGNTLMSLGPL